MSGPPLPAGWEALIDPNSRRTYYVNHNTKATSWEDPRRVQQQTQPPQYAPQAPRNDTTYQFGHRFCSSCGIEVTAQASTCICGHSLRS